MAGNDPRILIGKLEDLTGELNMWASSARETVTSAHYDQQLTEEQVRRQNYRLQIAQNQLADDQDSVRQTERALDKLTDMCQQGRSIAQQTVTMALEAQGEAEAALVHWKEELRLALEWLARARARLARALVALRQAQAELAAAQSELRYAENRLNACNNNDSRWGCGGEAAAVRQATARVWSALTAVDIALAEVRAAEEEVRQAEARVAACTQAVEYAKQAVEVAVVATQHAQQALAYAERSLEHAQAALNMLIRAKQHLEYEEKAVYDMTIAMRAATEATGEAAWHLRTADTFEDSAQGYAFRAQQALAQSVNELRELNQASLNSYGSIWNTISTGASHMINFLTLGAMGVAIWSGVAITQLPAPSNAGLPSPTPSNVTMFQPYDSNAAAERQKAKDLTNMNEAANKFIEADYEFEKKKEEDEEDITKRFGA